MIAPLPHDKALPGLWALLDETTMATMIEARLGTASGGAIEVTACRPKYVRYKPETSCLLQYGLSIRSGNHQADLSAHVRLFEDDRAQTRATSARLRRLQDRVAHEQPDLELPRVAWLPEVNGLLQIYPLDYDLRHLERAADASHVSTMLRKGLRADRDLAVAGEPELIRYKPERKALLRYRLENGPVEVLYAKVHVDDRSEILAAQTQALIAAGVSTPPALIAVPKRHFVAHSEAEGVQLASLRGTDSFSEWMAPLAESLRHLQSVELPALAKHCLADEVSLIQRITAWLGIIAPHLADRLARLGGDIVNRYMGVGDRLATGHGDFYDDQALVSSGGVTILDLDELRHAHPLLDVGNMLAHLTSGEDRGQAVGAAREMFLVDTLRQMPYTEADVALFEASALLKLAPGPFRRLDADWPEGIERILSLAEKRLAGAPKSGSPHSGSPPIADPDLPQLATLQDTSAMAARLSDVLGCRNGHIPRIDVVRHKPGRRAVLRFDLAHGEQLFGKTFASNRGMKVYEIARMIAAARAFGPGIALPDPVAWMPDLKLLLQRPVRGVPIDQVLLDGDRNVVVSVAFALHRFHTSGLDLGRTHDLARELEPLPMRAAQVTGACPELGEVARASLCRIQAIDGSVFAWRTRPVHRDFYHDQVLIDGDALAILDLDDAAMAEPLVDVANFRAHLMLLGAQRRGDIAALSLAGDAFVDQYRQLDPDLDKRLLEFLTATTLLRLAGVHVSRKDGVNVARLLIDAATRSLELGTIGAAPRHKTPGRP